MNLRERVLADENKREDVVEIYSVLVRGPREKNTTLGTWDMRRVGRVGFRDDTSPGKKRGLGRLCVSKL